VFRTQNGYILIGRMQMRKKSRRYKVELYYGKVFLVFAVDEAEAVAKLKELMGPDIGIEVKYVTLSL